MKKLSSLVERRALKELIEDAMKSLEGTDASTVGDGECTPEPKPKDEKEFVKLHKTEKHADREGNKSDVYNATNVKTIDRPGTRQGHKAGSDNRDTSFSPVQPVPEETELDETSKAKAERYVPKAVTDYGHVNFARQQTSGSEKSDYERKSKNRREGISRAFKSIDKTNEELDEARQFKTAYGWAGGRNKSGGTYKRPKSAAEKKDDKRDWDARHKDETKKEETQLDEVLVKNPEDLKQKYEFKFLPSRGKKSINPKRGIVTRDKGDKKNVKKERLDERGMFGCSSSTSRDASGNWGKPVAGAGAIPKEQPKKASGLGLKDLFSLKGPSKNMLKPVGEEIDEGKKTPGDMKGMPWPKGRKDFYGKKEPTVLVSPKGYKGGGKVHRIKKSEYDPKKHSMAEEEQLDEFRHSCPSSFSGRSRSGTTRKKESTVLVSPKGYKGAGKVTRIAKKDFDEKKHSMAEQHDSVTETALKIEQSRLDEIHPGKYQPYGRYDPKTGKRKAESNQERSDRAESNLRAQGHRGKEEQAKELAKRKASHNEEIEQLDELKKPLGPYIKKATGDLRARSYASGYLSTKRSKGEKDLGDRQEKKSQHREWGIRAAADRLSGTYETGKLKKFMIPGDESNKVYSAKKQKIYHAEETQLDEVITKDTPTSDVIHDFVHSKYKGFEGKSKPERIRMALGASYAKKRGK